MGIRDSIGTDEATLPNSTPMSVTQLPVGDFPDGWGIGTDVAIAQNSVFPNALAPTTQWSGITGFVGYDNFDINSGALPTGYQQMIESLPTLSVVSPVYGLPGAVPVYTGGTYGSVSYTHLGTQLPSNTWCRSWKTFCVLPMGLSCIRNR